MERVFVTGGTGFIGSELIRELSKQYEVHALVRTTSNRHALDTIMDVLDKIEMRYGNLTDYSTIRKIIKDISPHYIIHVGASTAVRHSFDNVLEFQKVNYCGTVNLAHSALDIPDFKKFIFASTMEVYGWQDSGKPFTEETKPNPESPYAVSKLAAEEYIRMAGKAYGLPYIISRACNTFGRKHNTGFIVEYLVTTMLRGETVYIGTPDTVRDLMYVDDHINAYITSLKSPVKNEIFNFGTGNMITIRSLAEKIKKMTDFKGDIVHNFPPDYPFRPVISPFLSLDSGKANRVLKWTPKVMIEDGLKKTVDYWKSVVHV
ncbi:MAG: GDP-mannose 4,6-dehydratase [Candidatus Aenigmarchaeota archaeon]|nr:GDP-mannose 4,6-dehydratase [Candidatus Aenigmarchaeota archaeon]